MTRALHLIAAAIWAGGLVFLAIAVGAARSTVPESERISLFRALGRRFAIVGGIALLVLIVTGTEMTRDRIPSLGDLTGTDYGRTLLIKLALVALVIVLTTFHSLVQGPELGRLRQQALVRSNDAALQDLIRRKSARAGVVSGITLLATLAILILAARLVTG